MKESVGEGSLSIATIVIIVAVVALAVVAVTAFVTSIGKRSEEIEHYCADGYHWSDEVKHCVED